MRFWVCHARHGRRLIYAPVVRPPGTKGHPFTTLGLAAAEREYQPEADRRLLDFLDKQR